jgi:hypothetical protein
MRLFSKAAYCQRAKCVAFNKIVFLPLAARLLAEKGTYLPNMVFPLKTVTFVLLDCQLEFLIHILPAEYKAD